MGTAGIQGYPVREAAGACPPGFPQRAQLLRGGKRGNPLRIQRSGTHSENPCGNPANPGGGFPGLSDVGTNQHPGNGGIHRGKGFPQDSLDGKAAGEITDGSGRPYAFGRFLLCGGSGRPGRYPPGLRVGVCRRNGNRENPFSVRQGEGGSLCFPELHFPERTGAGRRYFGGV